VEGWRNLVCGKLMPGSGDWIKFMLRAPRYPIDNVIAFFAHELSL
jgi:hypothetical protein